MGAAKSEVFPIACFSWIKKEYITTNTTWKISLYFNDVGTSDWLKGNVLDHGNQYLVIKSFIQRSKSD